MQFEVGSVVKGKVTGVTKFGAFVDIGEGKVGLVHISEISGEFVRDIADHVIQGQEVTVKILNIFDNNKMELSIKQANPDFSRAKSFNRKKDFSSQKVSFPVEKFEDMMNKFKKTSDEKMSYLNKRTDSGRRKSFHKNI